MMCFTYLDPSLSNLPVFCFLNKISNVRLKGFSFIFQANFGAAWFQRPNDIGSIEQKPLIIVEITNTTKESQEGFFKVGY